MQFTSLVFIVFLSVVFGLYWSARKPGLQNAILLISSYVFYGWWDYRFCLLILISSLIDYVVGRRIAQSESVMRKRVWLYVSLFSNIGLLCVFKYYGFFADNLQVLGQSLGWNFSTLTLNVILPVGISFYTFQTLSYTIDIYRGRLQPAKNVVEYLAFVSFFPQLVAGPIERGTNLLPQFQRRRSFNSADATDGCRLILWGFVKKLAIADSLAVVVDQIYGNWQTATGPELTIATVCFAFQIYCDFSAYSDIAIGTARLFSIRLMQNFAFPYFSQNINEFWSRWHISLSTWFRDYVYIPLGGNRCRPTRQHINIMLTFLLSGLWHGAAWTFIAWGALHGLMLSAYKVMAQFAKTNSGDQNQQSLALTTKTKIDGRALNISNNSLIPRPMTLIKMSLTFAIVCIGWIFFRADSLSAAWYILATMIFGVADLSAWSALVEWVAHDKATKQAVVILLAFVGVEWLRRNEVSILHGGPNVLLPVRWAIYTFLIWGTLDLAAEIEQQPFVYFALLRNKSDICSVRVGYCGAGLRDSVFCWRFAVKAFG